MLFKGTLNCDPNEPCSVMCRLNYMLYMQYSLNEKKISCLLLTVIWYIEVHNNISGISRKSVLLVEETRVPVENHLPVIDKLYHPMFYWIQLPWAGFELTMLVVIDNDCTGICKSKYHTMMTTKAHLFIIQRITIKVAYFLQTSKQSTNKKRSNMYNLVRTTRFWNKMSEQF